MPPSMGSLTIYLHQPSRTPLLPIVSAVLPDRRHRRRRRSLLRRAPVLLPWRCLGNPKRSPAACWRERDLATPRSAGPDGVAPSKAMDCLPRHAARFNQLCHQESAQQ
ncbi:hypothetical protein D1007_12341 [Hordeum vulgare]|nr:hypothetical protein D1007_12341 [Hordeum vulgare]